MDEAKNNTPPLRDDEYLVRRGDKAYRGLLDGVGSISFSEGRSEPYSVLAGRARDGRFTLLFRNTVYQITEEMDAGDGDRSTRTFRINGALWQGTIDDKRSLLAKRFGAGRGAVTGEVTIKSPMPGLVTKILVQAGDTVKKGDGLLILEAMKMENEVRAEDDGTISRIDCAEGTPVEKNAKLLIIHYQKQ